MQVKKAVRNQQVGRTGLDFANPTPDMVKDAEKYGIDLRDPLVQAELRRLERDGVKGVPPDDDIDDPAAAAPPGQGGGLKEPQVPWMRYFLFFALLGAAWRLADAGLLRRLWQLLAGRRSEG